MPNIANTCSQSAFYHEPQMPALYSSAKNTSLADVHRKYTADDRSLRAANGIADRVDVVPTKVDHASDLYRQTTKADPAARKFLPGFTFEDESIMRTLFSSKLPTGIEHRTILHNGKPVGLMQLELPADKFGTGKAKINFEFVDRDHRGQGIMSRALSSVTKDLLQKPHIDSVEALVDYRNAPSIRVHEKAGFVRGLPSLSENGELAWRYGVGGSGLDHMVI